MLDVGDRIELRGPIGGYFVWEPNRGGPLQLIAGGSGIAPLMAMLRERLRARSDVPVRMLLSWPSRELVEDVASALVELGHDPARVLTERFGPTGG